MHLQVNYPRQCRACFLRVPCSLWRLRGSWPRAKRGKRNTTKMTSCHLGQLRAATAHSHSSSASTIIIILQRRAPSRVCGCRCRQHSAMSLSLSPSIDSSSRVLHSGVILQKSSTLPLVLQSLLPHVCMSMSLKAAVRCVSVTVSFHRQSSRVRGHIGDSSAIALSVFASKAVESTAFGSDTAAVVNTAIGALITAATCVSVSVEAAQCDVSLSLSLSPSVDSRRECCIRESHCSGRPSHAAVVNTIVGAPIAATTCVSVLVEAAVRNVCLLPSTTVESAAFGSHT